MNERLPVQQVSLSKSVEQDDIILATAISLAQRNRDLKAIRKDVLERLPEGLSFNLHEKLSPFNVYIPQDFARYIHGLHRALDKALIDVVERWNTDKESGFPGRMPIEEHEEDLLRWIVGCGRDLVPRFRDNYGMWRTDYLLEKDEKGNEQAKICEINSRIPFNGFWIIGTHEAATGALAGPASQLKSPNVFAVSEIYKGTIQRQLIACRIHKKQS